MPLQFVGTIESLGSEVAGLSIGDRVMSPFTASCGACFYCSKGLTCRCSHPEAQLFGWIQEPAPGEPGSSRPRGLHGGQAQYVRVPLASSTLVKVPDDVSDEEALLLGDILSTAFFCAERGGVAEGDTVAVVGLGPVGLLAVLAARHLGAARVFAVDGVPGRRAQAAKFGAEPLAPEDAAAAAAAATGGRGADVVLEAVGAGGALALAFDLVRPAGVVSSVGVHTAAGWPFTPVDAYNKNATLRFGRCPARAYMERVLPIVQSKKWPFADIITHRMSLREGVRAYDMFERRKEGVIKVVLDPWR
ncbi:alcohol dehydrogenase GroES domain protein [Monoraphidium neglectum]|uniref:Alcohol dehydrogenase GroES domain protein n=1 Tax=Monoraphidium neglectum TaxID=145388 RepID=A0A0D2MRA0_9CHLO|nr:alcohol dehydrogenase GroES domain protein [Monoraphidium neglectum]KIZ02967.1 alcohol dehydrogenase GroES domain protein [Monoraphidium neglectum]|eukprot:XP_013901986.1 alcohol dehydrogenase GroES domain protein [Monoraphidium neglectum]